MARVSMLLQVVVLFVLTACTTLPSPQSRKEYADGIAATHEWQPLLLTTKYFDIVAYAARTIKPRQTLTIYIEGDGLAWLNASTPSLNPTPLEPLALKLALLHPASNGNVTYLSRPCQYTVRTTNKCPHYFWTHKRFAPEVIEAMNQAIDEIKLRHNATQLVLIGYSGGAAVAALAAAQRQDVTLLVTIAGNLNHEDWTRYHRLSPLTGSLNPADYAEQIANIPQIHFIGSNDRVITPELARRWPIGFTGLQHVNVHIVNGPDHGQGWVEQWEQTISNWAITPF